MGTTRGLQPAFGTGYTEHSAATLLPDPLEDRLMSDHRSTTISALLVLTGLGAACHPTPRPGREPAETAVVATPASARLAASGVSRRSASDPWPDLLLSVPGVDPRVAAFIGPTIRADEGRTLGGPFASFERRWVQFGDSHWRDQKDRFGNYYDRALNHYALWLRTGDPRWRRRADSIAVEYRTYLEGLRADLGRKDASGHPRRDPAPFSTSPHNTFPEGLAVHYLLTGDPASREAVAGLAHYAVSYRSDSPDYRYQEGRIQARGLIAALSALAVGHDGRFVSADGRKHEYDWGAIADEFVDNWVKLQREDGSFRYRLDTEDGRGPMGQSNFMEGLRANALIKYYQLRKQDPRVERMVRRMADYMATQWDAKAGAFRYHDVDERAKPTLADLNHLMVEMFGFAYHQTGEERYRTIGDAAFAAGEPPFGAAYRAAGAGEFLGGSKQFNQHYYGAFRYLAFRRDADR